MRGSKKQLRVEALETRDLPSSLFGNPWPNAEHLTLSFALDGARIPGSSPVLSSQDQTSGLFDVMNSSGYAAEWQYEILRAFQTWASQTNINLGIVSDFGQTFGPGSGTSTNPPTSNIRVGAFNTSQDVVAINQPYNILTGAWAGTLLYNASHGFSVGNTSGRFDVYTATLNEAANLFGLADTSDPTSALFGHYIGLRAGLGATDAAAIQALYGGARLPDQFEGNSGNEDLAHAARLFPSTLPSGPSSVYVSASGDLTTLGDVDNYVFRTAPGTTSATIRLNTVGLSLLNAKVSVYDANGNLVATATSAGPLSMQDVTITLTDAAPESDYTIRIERGTDDVFGIGAYQLAVGLNTSVPGGYVAPTTTTIYTSAGADSTMSTAAPLPGVAGSAGTAFSAGGSLDTSSTVAWYKVSAPETSDVMTVVLRPEHAYELYATVSVYDSTGNRVAASVLTNAEDGRYVIQVSGVSAAEDYFLKVESAGRRGVGLVGNFNLKVDFSRTEINLSQVITGSLSETQRQDFVTFKVPESKAFHFVLDSFTSNAAALSGLGMVIFDVNGTAVARMVVSSGSTTSGLIFLQAGTYFIKFQAATVYGAPLADMSFTLRALVVSDPIDAYAPPDDSILPGLNNPATPPTVPTPPVEYVTEDEGDHYYNALGLIDLWSNPWMP